MTRQEFEFLQSDQAHALIEKYIDHEPTSVALKVGIPSLSNLIKVLQKCKHKLPTYYNARCVVDQRAYEQSSSEATARLRSAVCPHNSHDERVGNLAIDLTCGLGVDTLALSRCFVRVISVEIDPLRADVTRYNFARIGVDNIEVVCAAAEEFVASYNGPAADLIYVDPSRRTHDARKIYSLEDSSPDILGLMPTLRTISRRVMVKLSPLFDIDEVFTQFGPQARAEVISLDGECKEVLAKIGFESTDPEILLTIIDRTETARYGFDRNVDPGAIPVSGDANYTHISRPDVAFYKSRTERQYIDRHHSGQGNILVEDYIFSEHPLTHFQGATFRIDLAMAYQPKSIRKYLKDNGIKRVNIHRRNFPYPADSVASSLGITLGGTQDLICTVHRGVPTVFFVTRIS